MSKTIVGLFEDFSQAERVVESLAALGVERSHISLISRQHGGTDVAGVRAHSDSTLDSAGAGAVGGTVLGGSLGLLAGIAALTIPGLGPVVAAGPLATALGSAALGAGIGAAAGGVIGALVNAGVPEEEAHVYAEGVRRGDTLVAAHVADEMAVTALNAMREAGAADVRTRGESLREEGWTRFDEHAEPHPIESAAAGATTGVAMGAQGGPLGTLMGGVVGAVQGVSGDNSPDNPNYGTPEDFSGQTGSETHAGSIEWEDGSTTKQSGSPKEPAAGNVEWQDGSASGKERAPTTTHAGTVEWEDGSESPDETPKKSRTSTK